MTDESLGEIAADHFVVQLYRNSEQKLIADEAEEDFAIHWRLGESTPGDTLLICTDGLNDTLGQQALEALFRAD
ncbi:MULTISPECIES: hypothetical protein [unclassified Thiocapsa]|uniref:hypothetical protein n=1 Tax=unclassified Thiocapsa TaxID=2641286 RepID=UPI0035B0BD73